MTTDQRLPDGWRRRRLRFDASLNPSKSKVRLSGNTEISFVPMDAIGELGGLDLSETRELADVYDGYTYFADDDVCIAKITPCFENGKGAIADGLVNGVAFGTTELHVVRAHSSLDERFLFYVSVSHDFRKIGASEMLGAGGQKRIREDFVKDWNLPLPPLKTQLRIVRFLDEKSARIDKLVENKRAFLERVHEKRQALISHVVTKGLDATIPKKDSGKEWLGQIPSHWEIRRLKEVCERIVDCKNRTPPNVDGGDYFVIRTSCLGNGRFDESKGYWTDEDAFAEWTKKGVPTEGDVLISREAPMGEACLFPKGFELCLGQRMMFARADKSKVNPDFLLYSIYSAIGREYVELRKKGSTVGHLRVPEIFNFPIILPTTDEQVEIVEYLQHALDQVDAVETQVENGIETLTEYRSALITAAVTGKIPELS